MDTLDLNVRDEGPVIRPEQDCSKEADEVIEEVQKMVTEENRIEDAIKRLLEVEKKARLAGDYLSGARLSLEVIRVSQASGDWGLVKDNLLLISQRRGQFKQPIQRTVQEVMGYLDGISDLGTRRMLIETLRDITEGKIYVEVERTRLTNMLAKMLEADGDIKGAAEVIQEVQIETVGSMDRREKFEFILQQMRLCLAADEYVKANMISKKVGFRAIDEEQFADLRVRFYRLMIDYHQSTDNFLEISRAWHKIFHTKMVQEKQDLAEESLTNAVLYAVLTPFDAEQNDLLLRLHHEKRIRELPELQTLAKQYLDDLLIEFDAIKEDIQGSGFAAFSEMEKGDMRLEELRKRTVEHNLRVVAKFYKQIHLDRLSFILRLSGEEAEQFVARLVELKTIYAKIDRVAGIVSFSPGQDPDTILNEWSGKVNELLNLVEDSCHLINRENMVAKLKK